MELTPKDKKRPWNYGKRKPIVDSDGLKWCNCTQPKLTSNQGGRGQALCLNCMNFWYN